MELTIRLVAGELNGTRGPVTEIAAAPLYMDVKLAPASKFILPIPSGHTALAYVFNGAGEFGDQIVESVSMVVFNDDGDQIEVKSETGVQFMLIAGAPFNEPIVPYGPFVMNTREEIGKQFKNYETAHSSNKYFYIPTPSSETVRYDLTVSFFIQNFSNGV